VEKVTNIVIESDGKSATLREIFERMNTKIEILKDKDHRIGHSYLMFFPDDEDENGKECIFDDETIKIEDSKENKLFKNLKEAWYGDIIPLLQEYFYNEWDKLKEILGEDFINREDKKIIIGNEDLLGFEDDAPIWEIEDFKDGDKFNQDGFLDALINLMKKQKESNE
jgi:5-methylcytosine-specific restriction protein B